MTFCGKEKQRRERALNFVKIGASDTKLAPTCEGEIKRIPLVANYTTKMQPATHYELPTAGLERDTGFEPATFSLGS